MEFRTCFSSFPLNRWSWKGQRNLMAHQELRYSGSYFGIPLATFQLPKPRYGQATRIRYHYSQPLIIYDKGPLMWVTHFHLPVSLSNLLDFRHKDSFDAINSILDNSYVWCLNDTMFVELRPNGIPYTQLYRCVYNTEVMMPFHELFAQRIGNVD